MSEQLIDGAANNWPKTLSKYTERYPTEESLPLITGMDFVDHHTDYEGRAIRTLSIYSGYSEVAGFPVDDYYLPDDDTMLQFKVSGFTCEDLEDHECEDDEGHIKGYNKAKIILLVLRGGVLPSSGEIADEPIEFQKDDEIVITPYQLMALIDTHYSHEPIRGSEYWTQIYR